MFTGYKCKSTNHKKNVMFCLKYKSKVDKSVSMIPLKCSDIFN